ncbi:FadR/GntR family transcriptional regulator [Actinopolymorpha alba]|uniref:FadR/GntR family transcriptional regulator n=1 Tax=Actinopolymorpha alba TaxID=533267 RepID=UPI000361D3C3|nr:FadR/GntR family transcriptional regulator [Actinopolymorpha alba]
MVQPKNVFRAVERSKVYASVVDQILQNIQSGRFPPGSSLPSERVLADQLAVSRGSLREAIRVLEHAGVLDVRVGSGTYVTEGGRSQTAMLRAQAAVIGEHSPLDLIVARAAIEPVCAEQAATAHHPTDLAHMEATLHEQAELTHQGKDPSAADLAFHLAVATASHNGVLLAIEQNLIELMHEQTWSELKHRSRSRVHAAEQYLEHHELVLGAIRRRDARRAHQLMAMHMAAIEVGIVAELERSDGPNGQGS